MSGRFAPLNGFLATVRTLALLTGVLGVVLVLDRSPIAEASKVRAPRSCTSEDLSSGEVLLLQALRERQRELREREKQVERRELEIRERESEFRDRIADAVARVERLEMVLELGKKAREARERRVMTLAKAIESLSPRRAAPMVASVDTELARELLLRLPPDRFGALLQAMPPQHAATLMREVAEKQPALPSEAKR